MIIQYYIWRELLLRSCWILGLIVLLFASSRFVLFMSDAAAGNIPTHFILVMLGCKTIATLPMIMPIVILIATLLTFLQISHHRELIALANTGINQIFYCKIILQFACLYALAASGVNLFLAPWAEQHTLTLKAQAKQEAEISNLIPGQFRVLNHGKRAIYIEGADDMSLKNIFIQEKKQGDMLSLIFAKTAELITDELNNKYIILHDGYRYTGIPGLMSYQITTYKKYAVLVEQLQAPASMNKLSAIKTIDLIDRNEPKYHAELQWRISLIVACLLLAFPAILIFHTPNPKQRYKPFFIGILLYLLYSSALSIGYTMLQKESVPPVVGLWWIHLLFIILLTVIYQWQTQPSISHRKRHRERSH